MVRSRQLSNFIYFQTKYIVKKWGVRMWTGLDSVLGSYAHDNKPSGSTKGEEYLYYQNEDPLFKKVSAPWI